MKIRASKLNLAYVLFKVRNFDLLKSVRRLQANPVADAEFVLKQVDGLRRLRAANDAMSLGVDSLGDDRIFIPAYRRDGVGIQAFIRICAMFLARQAHATYCHIPFLELYHQHNDPVGRSLSFLEWATQWETFLNLGHNEHSIETLVNQVGAGPLAKKMAATKSQFGRPGAPVQMELATFLQEFSADETQFEPVNVFDLRFFRDATAHLNFDAAFIEQLQAKFDANGYVPAKRLYDERYLDIAIHIRRGDVWQAYQAGEQRPEDEIRFVKEDYYVELLQRLQALFQDATKPVRFHIFSDGKPSDFPQFTFVNETEATLASVSGPPVKNIQFHLSQTALDSLYHLIKAPILVPAKSSFSFLAVLLGRSYVLYDRNIRSFYQYDFLADYMQRSRRFVRLDDLAGQVERILVDLTEHTNQTASSSFLYTSIK